MHDASTFGLRMSVAVFMSFFWQRSYKLLMMPRHETMSLPSFTIRFVTMARNYPWIIVITHYNKFKFLFLQKRSCQKIMCIIIIILPTISFFILKFLNIWRTSHKKHLRNNSFMSRLCVSSPQCCRWVAGAGSCGYFESLQTALGRIPLSLINPNIPPPLIHFIQH